MKLHKLYWAVAAFAVTAVAQTPDPAAAFEVASIRPSPPGGRRGVWTMGSKSLIQMLGMNLRQLMGFAYDVEGYRISAQGPAMTERYDVVAKVPDEVSGLSDKERWQRIHLMTRRLLAERFKLEFHRSSTEMPVYRLAVWKGGAKIKETGPNPGDNVVIDRSSGHLSAKSMPMSQLVSILTSELRRPVLDETGIQGVFDVALDWAPESLPARPGAAAGATNLADAPDTRPSIFTAVEEQLGLRLEAGKSTMEVLVVDRAERASEN